MQKLRSTSSSSRNILQVLPFVACNTLKIKERRIYHSCSPSFYSVDPVHHVLLVVLLHVEVHVGEMLPQCVIGVGPGHSSEL